MWRSSCTVNCVTMYTLLIFIMFVSSNTNASIIPILPSAISTQPNHHQDYDQQISKAYPSSPRDYENVSALPNSFSLITPEGIFASFENGTSLLRGKMHQRFNRVKRDVCKGRPDTEVMEYYDLKLANRCWDDCDCTSGRYCTKHSWCHDKE